MAGVTGDTFIIQGTAGRRVIDGSIRVNGSKNDAVQAVAAALLFRHGLALTNLPEIDDIVKMLTLVELLGVNVKYDERQTMITAPKRLSRFSLDREIAEKIRASILLTGPILARYGTVIFPHPGGCVIGERPIDLFLTGFAKMGATVRAGGTQHLISAPRGGLQGTEIFFKNQSVTATETFMMTALLARGQTILKNCALEPEIVNLGQFLIKSGARISGLGTSTMVITGGHLLDSPRGRLYQILPDRIEAGSFAILGALLAKRLRITHCRPEHLEALLNLLNEVGGRVKIFGQSVTIIASRSKLRAAKIKTHEYPGFPTDLQAPLAVLLTQTVGTSAIFETIFEGRVAYADALVKMGAKIEILDPHRLKIIGPTPLKGQVVTSPDLRAGLAYLVAGLVAKGQTIVHNIHCVDRGYERVDERLRALGLMIRRF